MGWLTSVAVARTQIQAQPPQVCVQVSMGLAEPHFLICKMRISTSQGCFTTKLDSVCKGRGMLPLPNTEREEADHFYIHFFKILK